MFDTSEILLEMAEIKVEKFESSDDSKNVSIDLSAGTVDLKSRLKSENCEEKKVIENSENSGKLPTKIRALSID